MRYSLIDSDDEYFESRGLRGIQYLSIGQAGEIGEARGFAIVIGEEMSQALVNALVDQQAH